MKNKLFTLILGFLVFCNLAIANTFIFETKNIEILKDKNQILAGKGKVFSSDKDLEINADKFEYLKNTNILKSNGNGKAIIKSKNLIIEFDQAIFNQKELTIEASGNVRIIHADKKFTILTEEIFFDQLKNQINSNSKTLLEDNFQNIHIVDSFIYEIENNLLKVVNLKSKDKDNNIVKTELAYINTKSGKLFGKDVSMNFNNSSFDEDNEPRLKANSITKDENITELTKGVFTTCKKRDKCPPWEISAEKIQHNSEKKIINYENAFLKVYTPTLQLKDNLDF